MKLEWLELTTTHPTDETGEHTRKHIDEMQHSQPDRPQLFRVGPARHVSNISDVVEGAGFIVLTDGQKGHRTLCDVSVRGPGGNTSVPVGRGPH